MRAFVLAGVAAAVAAATPAAAVLYRFDVTDPDANIAGDFVGTYTFFLDRHPTPSQSNANTFSVDGLTYSHGAYGENILFDTYTFYTAAAGGGFDDDENVYEGPQLFTGTTAAPTFRRGTFAIDDFVAGGSVTISGVLPEPDAWTLLVAGFGLVGAAVRRARRGARPAIAY